MELRHLQHFVAVAEEKHFTRASQRLNIAQSALSSSVRSLEDELQSRLFVRSTRSVRLTPAGQVFLEKAREALQVIQAGRQAVSDVEGLATGSLSIGTAQSLANFLNLPALIAAFHRTNPGIEVRLRQGDTPGLIEQLRSGRLDLAFLPLLDPPDDIATRVIACEDLVVVTPPGHDLIGRGPFRLRELVRHPFVDYDSGWATRPLVDMAFAVAGLTRHTAFEVTDLETLVDLVAEGLGIALLPEVIAESRRPQVAIAGPTDPAICWELVVAHAGSAADGPLSGAARAFAGLLTYQDP